MVAEAEVGAMDAKVVDGAIDPAARVEPGAVIGKDVSIGPCASSVRMS